MSENKYTPGYWRTAADPLHFDSHTDVVDSNGGLIASMCGASPERSLAEMEANAKLVAYVPKLLEALRFYADPEIYKPHPHGPAFEDRDKSHVAIAALSRAGGAK